MRLARDRSRRRFLFALLGGAGFISFAPARRTRAAFIAPARTITAVTLTHHEDRISILGARCYADNANEARKLARFAASELPAWSRLASPQRRARLVRERLLRPERLAVEFEREEVVEIDGWMLARSEAATAVYLHTLARGAGRG